MNRHLNGLPAELPRNLSNERRAYGESHSASTVKAVVSTPIGIVAEWMAEELFYTPANGSSKPLWRAP